MIDLYTVKRHNSYSFVQDTLPSSDGTWLCSLTATSYTRGHSYEVVGGVATRIEVLQDELIQENIAPTIQRTFDWLNNSFFVRRALQENNDYSMNIEDADFPPIDLGRKFNYYLADTGKYTFASNVVTGISDDIFKVGDLVRFMGGFRNNVCSYVTAVGAGTITVDGTRDTEENYVCFVCDIPKAVSLTIEQMINFDVFKRELSDKKSETIGNYSYTNMDNVGGIDYPRSLVSNLNSYRNVRFVS